MNTAIIIDKIGSKIYHPVYRYAGTLDQVGILNDKSALIDIKTGAYQPWWALQTAAYNAVSKCHYRYSLELHGDGKYKLIQHKKTTDLQAFLACLTVFNLKQQYGRK